MTSHGNHGNQCLLRQNSNYLLRKTKLKAFFCSPTQVNSWKRGKICDLVYWFIYGEEISLLKSYVHKIFVIAIIFRCYSTSLFTIEKKNMKNSKTQFTYNSSLVLESISTYFLHQNNFSRLHINITPIGILHKKIRLYLSTLKKKKKKILRLYKKC